MDMFSLLAASLMLVSATPDCRIGLASDLIVSPLSTPGHYHPESRVEPGTVTHFFTSGSPQWGFGTDGDDSAAGPASGEANLSRLHLRAMYLGCDVAANRAELESLAQTLESVRTGQDWPPLGRAYIAILLYEIYAAIDAQGGERDRLASDLDAISYNYFNADYFRALTSASDAYTDALAAIEASDYPAYLAALQTMADSHGIFLRWTQRDSRGVIGNNRLGDYGQSSHNMGLVPLYFVRSRILRAVAARLRQRDAIENGNLAWEPAEFAIFDEMLGDNTPAFLEDFLGSLEGTMSAIHNPPHDRPRVSAHTPFFLFLHSLSVVDTPWRTPYEHSPYLWAQYQQAMGEATEALHGLRYDPDATEAEIEAGILPFNHTDYTCAAEARYEAARDVLDGLFDLEPLTPTRCEPVVADRVLDRIE